MAIGIGSRGAGIGGGIDDALLPLGRHDVRRRRPPLDRSRSVGSLAAGGGSSGSATVTVPADTPSGSYVIACADDQHTVAENNEGNNCLVSPSRVKVRR